MACDESRGADHEEAVFFKQCFQLQQGVVILAVAIYDYRNGRRFVSFQVCKALGAVSRQAAIVNHDGQMILCNGYILFERMQQQIVIV